MTRFYIYDFYDVTNSSFNECYKVGEFNSSSGAATVTTQTGMLLIYVEGQGGPDLEEATVTTSGGVVLAGIYGPYYVFSVEGDGVITIDGLDFYPDYLEE